MEFEDRVVVVTGAASGIGAATAELLADSGAVVVMGDRDRGGLDAMTAKLSGSSGTVEAVVFDQADSESASRLISGAVERHGRIDSLLNIAAISEVRLLTELTDEQWAATLRVNLSGVFYLCRAVLPVMVAQRTGSIVNMSSCAATSPFVGTGPYSASKAGLEALTRVLALEGAPHVRVNAVAPGPTSTPMFHTQTSRGTTADGSPSTDASARAREAVASKIAATTLLARIADPKELAEAILFLACDRASFITGQVLHVNGGRVLGK